MPVHPSGVYGTSHRGQPRHPHCTTRGRLHLDVGAVAYGSESSGRKPRLRADQLAYGLAGQLDTFVDVAITCPTAPTTLSGTPFRHGKAVQTKFQHKYREYATAAWTQPGGMGLQPQFMPLFWETFGFTHPKWLASFNTLRPSEISCSRRFLGLYGGRRVIVERASRRLSWFKSLRPDMFSAALWRRIDCPCSTHPLDSPFT